MIDNKLMTVHRDTTPQTLGTKRRNTRATLLHGGYASLGATSRRTLLARWNLLTSRVQIITHTPGTHSPGECRKPFLEFILSTGVRKQVVSVQIYIYNPLHNCSTVTATNTMPKKKVTSAFRIRKICLVDYRTRGTHKNLP